MQKDDQLLVAPTATRPQRPPYRVPNQLAAQPQSSPGSKLKRITAKAGDPDQFTSEFIGWVLACPNIPREMHAGYQPDDAENFGREFFDKILYLPVTEADEMEKLESGSKLSSAGELKHQRAARFFEGIEKLGERIDCAVSCGCSCTSDGTEVVKVLFVDDDTIQYESEAALYTVAVTKFSTKPIEQRWVAEEIWIADPDARSHLMATDEFKVAAKLHRPSTDTCNQRRIRVQELVTRLRAMPEEHVAAINAPDPNP